MESQFGFAARVARKPPLSPPLSEKHGEGRPSHSLLQSEPRLDQGLRQQILTPILKRKITINSFSQCSDSLPDNRSQGPAPGPARQLSARSKVAGDSSGWGPGPSSPRPGWMGKVDPGSSPAPARDVRCVKKQPGQLGETVTVHKDVTIAEAQRQKADLDRLLEKAAVLLRRGSAGQTSPSPRSELCSVQSAVGSGPRKQNSQHDRPRKAPDFKPASPPGSECFSSRSWADLERPCTQLPATARRQEPLFPPADSEDLGLDYSGIGPSHKTKPQSIPQRADGRYSRGLGEAEPSRDERSPQVTYRVSLGPCSLIPAKDTASHGPSPEGALRDGRTPTSLHRSLSKDARSAFECRSLIPTRDAGFPRSEQRPGFGDRLSPPPTENRPPRANHAEQEAELSAPVQFRKIRRRMQRGGFRDILVLREQHLPASSGPLNSENWNQGQERKQDTSDSFGFTLVPKRRTSPEGLEEDRKLGSSMSEVVPDAKPKPAVPMKPSAVGSQLLGYVGIDTIIEQMRRKTMKTGFDFNIMVVGQSGLGKSTLVNTLFKSQVSRKSCGRNREEKVPKTVEIKTVGHVIEEKGVKMKLTVIDTPGFGDQINNDNCWEPIEKYISEQYEKFLKEEANISRKKRIPDTRVHCCLYFISPTGHSLRPLDIEFMKRLGKIMNIIPVIAKADTMTLEERHDFKLRVRKELEANNIEFYPQREFDEDMEDKIDNDKIRETMPFAIVGSDTEYQINGKRVLGRKTPWGIIEDNGLFYCCDETTLRLEEQRLIFHRGSLQPDGMNVDFSNFPTHLQDLKEVTHNIFYETYRAKRLNENGNLTNDTEEVHESNL